MQTIKVLNGHVLADMVSEEQLFEAADLNGISITDVLAPGILLSVPDQKRARLSDETIAPLVKPVTAKAVAGQTWVDLVLQQLGDEARLFELCDNNSAGITDEIAAGTMVQTPEVEPNKRSIVNVLKQTKPASELVVAPGGVQPEGIEYWAIEIEFTVS